MTMHFEMDLPVHTTNFSTALKSIEDFLEKSYSRLPAKLHHFAPDYFVLSSILENKQMWASHSYDMNDPSEIRYGSNLVIFCLIEMQRRYASRNIFQLNEFFEMALERANPYTNGFNGLPEPFVISLCEDGHSSSQWERYGNKGKGYCINFDTTKPTLTELKKNDLVLLKVIYDVRTQISLINAAIQREVDNILANQRDPNAMFMGLGASGALYQLLLFYAISFKSPDWSVEKEWRLVRGTNWLREPIMPEKRDKNGKEVRYTRINLDDFAYLNVYDISVGVNVLSSEADQVPALFATIRKG